MCLKILKVKINKQNFKRIQRKYNISTLPSKEVYANKNFMNMYNIYASEFQLNSDLMHIKCNLQ